MLEVLAWIVAQPAFAITNLKDGEVLRYPIALVRGVGAEGSVEIENRDNKRLDGKNKVTAVGGSFKVLVELKPGKNRLSLKSGKRSKGITLNYEPQTNDYSIKVIYLTASEGNTAYLTQLRNDPQNYQEKFDTAAKLMQTFTAETMNDNGHGRATFRLDMDQEGKVNVLTVKLDKTADWLRSQPDGDTWSYANHWLDTHGFYDRSKAMVLFNWASYDGTKAKGHFALGGGHLGMFSTLSLSTWPNSIRDVERAFTDTTLLDTAKVLDDSVGRSDFWGEASTGMGAMLHELGHALGSPHSNDPFSVMSRGFDRFNRVFLVQEASSKRSAAPVDFKDNERMRWDPWIASLFAASRTFAMDAYDWQDGAPPRVYIDFTANHVVVYAPHGVRLIRLSKPTDPPSNTNFKLFESLPKVVRMDRGELRNILDAKEGAWLSVVDGQGQEYSLNEGELKIANTLPPNTSREQFEALKSEAQTIENIASETWRP